MARPSYTPGDLIHDKYEIKAIVGAGGFSRVYRAVDLKLGRDVALKVMSPRDDSEFSDTETVLKRFDREARLVSQLTSPHTITVHDYEHLPDGRLYMALEFVDGTTLEEMFDRGAEFDPERIVRIAVQMLEALAEAHATGILHRDIKPSNVMLYDRYGQADCVKLLDFGIAKKVATEEARHDDLTAKGALIGTPRYMSPEQLKRMPLTAASDLYSVGLLLHEMWTGESAFETTDVTEIYRTMQLSDELAGVFETAPQPLRGVAQRLLQPDPEDRFESAEEVLEALGHRLDGASTGRRARAEKQDRAVRVQPGFPVGFDRVTDAPSSELTSVDTAAGELTTAGKSELASSAELVPSASPDPSAPSTPGDSAPPSSGVPSESDVDGDEPDLPSERSRERRSRRSEESTESSTDDERAQTDWRRRFGTVAGLVGATLAVAAIVWGGLVLWAGGSSESTSRSESLRSRADPSQETVRGPAAASDSAIAARASAAEAIDAAVETAEQQVRTEASPSTEPASESRTGAPAAEAEQPRPSENAEPAPKPTRGGEEPAERREPAETVDEVRESPAGGDSEPSGGDRDPSDGAKEQTDEGATGIEVEPLE